MVDVKRAATAPQAGVCAARAAAAALPAVKTPPALYHWASYASAQRLGATSQAGQLQLKKIDPSFDLAQLCPALANRAGLFTWSDPITGACANFDEMYARPGDAVLLKLDIKPDAKTVELKTYGDGKSLDADLSGVDIVLHRRYAGLPGDVEPAMFQEYVVLNPAAVKSFSADPKRLGAELRKALDAAAKPGFEFDPSSVHSNAIGAPFMDGMVSELGLKKVRTIVDSFLASKDAQIADVFDHGSADARGALDGADGADGFDQSPKRRAR